MLYEVEHEAEQECVKEITIVDARNIICAIYEVVDAKSWLESDDDIISINPHKKVSHL